MSLAAGSAAPALAPECPIAGPAKAIVDDYLDHCHSSLLPNPDGWLFLRPDGAPLGEAALRHGIAAETRRAIGIALNPSGFRHLAAALVLNDRPGDLDLVGHLLGHRDRRTTAWLYAAPGLPGAAAAYAAALNRRAGTPPAR